MPSGVSAGSGGKLPELSLHGQSSSGPQLHCIPSGVPVSAPISRACQVGKLCLLGVQRHSDVTRSSFEVQEGPQAGQWLLHDLFLSKHLRKSSHRHFRIRFQLLESSWIFPLLLSSFFSWSLFSHLSPKLLGALKLAE